MGRFHQVLLITTFIPLCWLAMMTAHELGHVLAALGTGGTVTKVVLHPLALSRTDVSPNPSPLVEVWAGPVIGVLLPISLYGLAAWLNSSAAFLLRFFAGFCLVANGMYIGSGSLGVIGDAGEMMRHGSPIVFLWIFWLLSVPAGIWLWNGQGHHFGLGNDPKPILPAVAYGATAALTATVVAMSLLSEQM